MYLLSLSLLVVLGGETDFWSVLFGFLSGGVG